MGVLDFLRRRSTTLAQPTPERPDLVVALREMGAPGTIIQDGFLVNDDKNREWANLTKRVDMINEMRRTDSQIKAILHACKTPIIACQWIIREPEGATEKDNEIADFVRKDLYGMTNPWTETLSQILTYLDFGFSIFEVIYELGDDEKFHWKKWAPRQQSSVYKWNAEPDGGLRSITQNVWKDNGYREITLSVERLLVFTNWKEAANWEGESILRAAWKPYYLKDKLTRIDAIAHERNGVGLPVIKVPPGAGASDLDIAEQILIDMRSHEKGYVVEPEGFELRILEIPGQPRSIMESIKHHNEEITRVVLASFLTLGSTESGSRALGESKTDFFLASLNTYTSYIAGIINRHAIRDLVDVNFGVQKRYPELKAIPVAGIDFDKMASSLMKLAQTGLIVPDPKTINHVTEVMGLPRPDPKEVKKFQDLLLKRGLQGAGGSQDAKSQQPKQNGSSSNGSKPKPKSTKPTTASEDVAAVIHLQVQSLKNRIHSNTPSIRIQPPMEGTLARAMTLSCEHPNTELIEDAAREFSRRLAYTARVIAQAGGPEFVSLDEIDAEAERALPLLLAAMQEQPISEDLNRTQGVRA